MLVMPAYRDYALPQAHKAMVIKKWSEAEHARMQVMLAKRRAEEMTRQEKLNRTAILAVVADTKVCAVLPCD